MLPSYVFRAARAAAYIGFLVAACRAPAANATVPIDDRTTEASTDFLSDEQWRRLPREERHRRSRASYTVRFEPSGAAPSLERLAQYVERYAEINIFDRRLSVFNVEARAVPGTTGTIELQGEVNVSRFSRGIESTLRDLGFEVRSNTIELLPAASLGEQIYGVAKVSTATRSLDRWTTFPANRNTARSATLRKEPRDRAEQVDSVPPGGWVRLLREARPSDLKTTTAREIEGNWLLAQSSEGYVGFVREEDFTRTAGIPQAAAVLMEPLKVRASGGETTLPVGTYLYPDGKTERPLWTYDRSTKVDSAAKVTWLRPVFTAEQILAMARPLMGTHYEWGGVTELGIDCSGLTQFICKNSGVWLPRDAEEQAIVGQIVAFDSDIEKYAQAGDLIFFVNDRGKINHVAVSLGGNKVLHSSGRPGVHEATLDASSEENSNSMRDRVLWVRRVMTR